VAFEIENLVVYEQIGQWRYIIRYPAASSYFRVIIKKKPSAKKKATGI